MRKPCWFSLIAMEDSDPDAPLTDLLFSPPNISVLILSRPDDFQGRIDRHLKVELRDCCSAELVLFNGDTDKDELRYILDLKAVVYKEEEEVDAQNNLCAALYQLQRDDEIIKFQVIPTSEEGFGDVQAFDFLLGQYAMKDETTKRADTTGGEAEDDPNVVAKTLEDTGTAMRVALRSGGAYTGHAIRFMGQQYTSIVANMFSRTDSDSPQSPEVPAVLGTAATDTTSATDDPAADASAGDSSGATGNSEEALVAAEPVHSAVPGVDEDESLRAQERRRWAEGVHSVTASAVGAVLFPVRWTGRMASQLGGKGGSDRPREVKGPVSKAMLDTMGGLGNGLMAVCKGVTEALGEVGSAIGDSAMHHATTIHGPEYAENVTKHYVNAASELGLAGYKVANVATLGWQGVLVNAALEGTTFLISLYEYLIGPVLLQGYMDMIQPPLVQARRYFVVLRPWSIAFYKATTDITRKPYKIIATCMLDTLPKLRTESHISGARADFVVEVRLASEPAEPRPEAVATTTVSVTTTEPQTQPSNARTDRAGSADESDSLYWHRSDYDAFEEGQHRPDGTGQEESDSLLPRSGEKADPDHQSGAYAEPAPRGSFSAAMHRTAGRLRSVASSLSPENLDAQWQQRQGELRAYLNRPSAVVQENSGDHTAGVGPHIETCTVDCSTYLLYPPEDMLHIWYDELVEAASRVETIAKRKSGADEIALYRRLDLFPISTTVTVQVRRFVRTTPKPSLFDMFTRKRSALNTAEEGEGADARAAEGGTSRDVAASEHEDSSDSSDEHAEYYAAREGPEEGLTPNALADAADAAMDGTIFVDEGSDSEDGYESAHFWAVEEPGFLDGSYFDVAEHGGVLDEGEAAQEDGEAPGDRSAPVSPVPIAPSPTDQLLLEQAPEPPPVSGTEGASDEPAESAPRGVQHPLPMPSTVAVAEIGASSGGASAQQRPAHKTEAVAGGMEGIKRPYFSPEVQCSLYPISNTGPWLLCFKY